MVPIVEMASSPRHIEEPLYLYEPAVPKDEGNRQERDSVISRILDKDRYARMCYPSLRLLFLLDPYSTSFYKGRKGMAHT